MMAGVSTNPPPSDRLHKAILAALETETKKIVDEEAKKAAERVEERVRGQLGQIAAQVASYVNYDAIGSREIRITVRLPDRDKGAS